MRTILLCVLFLSLGSTASTQVRLSNSIKHSPYTYIYKITLPEARHLYYSDIENVNEKNLHTLVDSFRTGQPQPALPHGNYLLLRAKENRLQYDLITSKDLDIKLLSNETDLLVALHTPNGELVTDARVMIRKQDLHFNKRSSAFGPYRGKKLGLILVEYKDVIYPYEGTGGKQHQTFFYWLAHSFPLKYVSRLIENIKWKREEVDRSHHGKSIYSQHFKGFVVFSKPKYKPGDTVQLKAFILTKEGNPVDRELSLRLWDANRDTDTVLTAVNPYRPGGYTYEFVLNDSLDLELDDEYYVSFQETGTKTSAAAHTYDRYVYTRQALISGSFKFEEYELDAITFFARSNKKEHYRGEEVTLFVKAADDNGLAAMDGRVKFTLISTNKEATFHGPHVFLPDTLWKYEQPMDAVGETRINIPDSVFPKASFSYEIKCQFLNSNNESQYATLYQTFSDQKHRISVEQEGDSLQITYSEYGKQIKKVADIELLNAEYDLIEERSIELPATIKINPFANSYDIYTDSAYESFDPQHKEGMVSCSGFRTRDSIALQLINPQKLNVWYTVFDGNKIIARGYGDAFDLKEKVAGAGNSFISLQYVYAGEIHKEDIAIPYQDKLLTINVDQPLAIYPGQTAKISIDVIDANGKPVPDADVTAYAQTSKFGSTEPYVPYLGKYYRGRAISRHYEMEESRDWSHDVILNWERWAHQLKLDTVEYYKFIYPNKVHYKWETTSDGITQLAPFVVYKGEIQPIYMIYIDERPTFFNQAEHLQQYSFRVEAGVHNLRLRTRNKMITLNSVVVKQGHKTLISIDADTSNMMITVKDMPEFLTSYETQLWSKYMLVIENDFPRDLTYVYANGAYTIINAPGRDYNQKRLTGPYSYNQATYTVDNYFSQNFETEGGWQYKIHPQLIKQKQFAQGTIFNDWLPSKKFEYNFGDEVLTNKHLDSLREYYLDQSIRNHFYNSYSSRENPNGELRIGIDQNTKQNSPIRTILVFRNDNPDFSRIYSGNTTNLGNFEAGQYRIMLLYKNEEYYLFENVIIQQRGVNYYNITPKEIKKRDSTSIRIMRLLRSYSTSDWQSRNRNLETIKETFNEQYLDLSHFTTQVTGTVVDDKGDPIPYASVMVKGTRVGTVTDDKGNFRINIPAEGILQTSAVGFTTTEMRVHKSRHFQIVLYNAANSLSEVVVVGYGMQRKASVSGSVSYSLSGRVSGLSVTIRGVSSASSNNAPLVFVDGLPFNGRVDDLDPSMIASTEVLKTAEGIAMYGNIGANGVIIITTKKKASDIEDAPTAEGNTIRSRFQDHAFWQPKLSTDANGKVSFTTTFPDDITNWNTYVIAMGPQKQTGFTKGSIKSFKMMSGNLALPQFAVVGDSINVIGKTLNYQSDSLRVKRTFFINGEEQQQKWISLRNSWIDTFPIAVVKKDSIKMKYTIEKENGYFDGEERSIPVLPTGVLETKGFFTSLRKDTVFIVNSNTSSSTIKIHAATSLLLVFCHETEYLRKYEYLCNEQLASKLKGLLVQKRIDDFLERPFKGEKDILDIIKRLSKSKAASGLWGWWSNNDQVMWISLHVIQALVDAEQQGYKVEYNKSMLVDYLIFQMESSTMVDKLRSLQLLHKLEAKVDYKRYIDTVEKYSYKPLLYEALNIVELKQKLGMSVVIDTFISKKQQTVFGNTYWGYGGYEMFDNSIQNTLIMYRILRNAGGHEELLASIRNYFLEQRKGGNWRNTYESSLILETILPELFLDMAEGPAKLTITGNDKKEVTKFPFEMDLKSGESITVSKTGGFPVYFTAYEQYWNSNPVKVDGNFVVTSSFERNNSTVTDLRAGENVMMKINVKVKADADYVMVEVPIPAGCSYEDKRQSSSWMNAEVHREHFKNKVSIFCSKLQKGDYTFYISLMPRFTGRYSLNPAKAEMMYFPVFYGREGMKKVDIR